MTKKVKFFLIGALILQQKQRINEMQKIEKIQESQKINDSDSATNSWSENSWKYKTHLYFYYALSLFSATKIASYTAFFWF